MIRLSKAINYSLWYLNFALCTRDFDSASLYLQRSCRPLSCVRRWEHWALVFKNLSHSVTHIKGDGCSVFVGQERGRNRPRAWRFTHFRLSASWKYNSMLLLHVQCVTRSWFFKMKYCVTSAIYVTSFWTYSCHLQPTTTYNIYLPHRVLMLLRTTVTLFQRAVALLSE